MSGGGSIKDVNGQITVDDAKIKEVWREYFDRISNEEFAWNREDLEEVNKVQGPAECITAEEV